VAVVIVGALLGGGGFAALVRGWELRVRTPLGSALWLRVESFRRFLHESETFHAEEAAKPRAAPPEPVVAPFADAQRQALEAKSITIDLMILYTSNVAKHYIRDPADLLALAVEETNQTFRNSGLGNITLRLVHSELLDYDGSVGDQFNHLYRMVDGLGPFKDVKKLRDEKRADIVGLIIDNPNGCGLSTRIGPESDEAFFVVRRRSVLRR